MNDEKKLGQEPAFAAVESSGKYLAEGMSKRFYAACAAMQGILSYSGNINGHEEKTPREVCNLAYQFADELLKQENEL